MRYYITTRQNTPLIHHIICTENIGMDPVVPCLFDDFFAAFLTKSGAVAVFFACSQRRFTGDDRHREVLRAAVMVEAGYLDTDRQVSRAVGGEHPLIELISLCVRTGRDLRRRFS